MLCICYHSNMHPTVRPVHTACTVRSLILPAMLHFLIPQEVVFLSHGYM